jgi:hypothetical protein
MGEWRLCCGGSKGKFGALCAVAFLKRRFPNTRRQIACIDVWPGADFFIFDKKAQDIFAIFTLKGSLRRHTTFLGGNYRTDYGKRR